MITTNLVTFELSFTNSTETIIFNVGLVSLTSLKKFLKENDYLIIDKVKEYDRTQSKFRKANKQRLLQCTDHVTELNLLLTNKK